MACPSDAKLAIMVPMDMWFDHFLVCGRRLSPLGIFSPLYKNEILFNLQTDQCDDDEGAFLHNFFFIL